MITLKELSARCGVSIATISNVINGKENVSERTKKKVLKEIKESGYQPNFLASSLRSQKSRTIGIVIEDINAFSTPQQIEGIMAALEKRNYRCILENMRFYSRNVLDNEDAKAELIDQAFRQMSAIKVDGIIYVAAHGHNVEGFPKYNDLPVVICYAQGLDSKYPFVTIDDEKSGYELTKHIISKRYKKIGVITGVQESIHTERRLNGYKLALKEAGIPFDEKLIVTGNWNRESGYQGATAIVEAGADSVFCMNDQMAGGFIDWLKENHKEPGIDFGVVGFDGREFASFMNPVLTTMSIPLWGMGNRAAEMVLALLNGEELEKTEVFEKCILKEGRSL